MVIQSFVFPADVCGETELFYRSEAEGKVLTDEERKSLTLNQGAVLSGDTYMNFFDKTFWRRYTCVTRVELAVCLMGTGEVELYENETLTQTVSFQCETPTEFRIHVDMRTDGTCFFQIRAEETTVFYKAAYQTNEQAAKEVKLAVLVCTYHREEMMAENLRCLGSSQFFEKDSPYYGDLFLYVTDNAATLRKEDLTGMDPAIRNMEDHLCMTQSENMGGSGGFTNCILEMRKNRDGFPATHVVFMDDDVRFHPETFYRLCALLSYIRPEYESEAIAGRMFRMDERNIQYTALEVWNKGDLIHRGFQEDMCKKELALACNEERGEYAGWWLAVYPSAFVAENLPLPFFLHCDDVEYGLRHKGSPLVLNGIQVWHDTYEHRTSLEVTYYDVRNRMTVNALYGLLPDKEAFLNAWKEQITKRHVAEEYLEEHMWILAMRDFLKGKRYFLQRDIGKEHQRVCREAANTRANRKYSILWRLAAVRITLFYKRIERVYQQ